MQSKIEVIKGPTNGLWSKNKKQHVLGYVWQTCRSQSRNLKNYHNTNISIFSCFGNYWYFGFVIFFQIASGRYQTYPGIHLLDPYNTPRLSQDIFGRGYVWTVTPALCRFWHTNSYSYFLTQLWFVWQRGHTIIMSEEVYCSHIWHIRLLPDNWHNYKLHSCCLEQLVWYIPSQKCQIFVVSSKTLAPNSRGYSN